MKTYDIEEVLRNEDIYHIDHNGCQWANYDTPAGQIPCVEVGTLHRGEWVVIPSNETIKLI